MTNVACDTDENIAVSVSEFGGTEVLTVSERAIPTLNKGEALVRVKAATVNPTDILFRKGDQAERLREFDPPYVPGMEMSGEVLALHPSIADNTRVTVSDRVAGVMPPWRAAGGAQARFVAVDIRSLVAVPASIDDFEAATLPMNGLTALMILELCELERGGVIMVTGGPGALGGYVLSAARHRGYVTIADGRRDDEPLLAQLGAEHIVPRGQRMLASISAIAPDGVDAVADCAQLGGAVSACLRSGHVLVQVRPDSAPVESARIHSPKVSVPTQIFNTQKLEEVMRLADSGVFRARIGHIFKPVQVGKAHQLIERGGLRGRLVLDFR